MERDKFDVGGVRTEKKGQKKGNRYLFISVPLNFDKYESLFTTRRICLKSLNVPDPTFLLGK